MNLDMNCYRTNSSFRKRVWERSSRCSKRLRRALTNQAEFSGTFGDIRVGCLRPSPAAERVQNERPIGPEGAAPRIFQEAVSLNRTSQVLSSLLCALKCRLLGNGHSQVVQGGP
ncbi:hypothetical protein E5E91_16200 (plasmid) [Deinococcus radiodurans R1 = ATCC 13939 = DSM 20539]|uniref:Uncharacterized protein n=1 Tax=Deinococcus radiodurans (strain ATCC 13939 / DSM 20539 / JCM 16871 / CCUG 27074 / LMG 4051 / NBRC 15346 / NCIMB 9279 / VKM B-1422 / R1) TaxID=243230 RepID=Q9RZK0_DEIRA|nr:hypothetical protein DR_B0127 [Deinococcus radiodurans R1 = ATCC 13939 = DSM 20539]ANC73237.1 hypothetical protein A2G07_15415 [Deinococcus radiodurans R1 = ATCC 13939 = DSM 20539]QEM73225.1 hypothetical protein DXG80_15605 [Deinococcus radiodurans]UDL02251.1 hypothetical protein E5E91_16200 [Deinococcus radiodurans R1 = ATCC 13939 = DSM 20539]